MKRIIHITLLGISILLINGCDIDGPNYSRTDYKQLNIAKLDNISGKAYQIQGSGITENFNGSRIIDLVFCKNNRYLYDGGTVHVSRLYRGTYRVDLARDEIIMTGDDLDSSGKHLHGVIKTRSGYFEQKKKYVFEGLGVRIDDLERIQRTENCVIRFD